MPILILILILALALLRLDLDSFDINAFEELSRYERGALRVRVNRMQ